MRCVLFVVVLLLLALPASPAAAQDPPLPSTSERVLVGHETTPVAPGVTHTAFDWVDADGWVRGDVLSVDLVAEHVTSDLLHPGTLTDPVPLSEQVARRDAAEADRRVVGAVNGDFFDINRTGAPMGPSLQGGQLLGSASGSGGVGGGTGQAVGVDAAGLGRLLDLGLEGTVTTPAEQHDLDALNQPRLGPGDLGAYTPLWGDGSRAMPVEGATAVTEVVVDDGTVTAVGDAATATPIPDDGFVLLGREAAAEALAALTVGDAVSLSYAPRTEPAVDMAWAVGGSRPPLVVDGQVTANDDPTLAPRTAIGFSADGATAYLVTVDGRQASSRGLALTELAELMIDLGADDALNLDGGGSTTMLARHAGDAAGRIVNSPSDGAERATPNGVGILAPTGSGSATHLRVEPAIADEDARRALLGLTRTLSATGIDETGGPAAVTPDWTADGGAAVDGGAVTPTANGPLTVSAADGDASGSVTLDVVGPLARIATEPASLALADTDSEGEVTVVGFDADGYRVPIEPQDVTVTADADVVAVDATDAGTFAVTPATATGATVAEVTVAGVSAALPVTVGFDSVVLDDFSEPERWYTTTARASSTLEPSDGRDDGSGLRLDYSFDESTGTRAAYVRPEGGGLPVPGQPRRIALQVDGDGQGAWLRMLIRDAGGTTFPVDLADQIDWTGWRRVEGQVPDGVQYPVEIVYFYPVEIVPEKQYDGSLRFDDLEALVPPTVDAPPPATVRDPVIARDGFEGERWTFAVMSDAQFTADDPDDEIVRLARETLREIRASDADFLVINGDFTDRGRPEDLALARQILAEELGDALPWHYVPGNHEAYEGTPSGGVGLDSFRAEFGDTFRTFDHAGTRFVLLNSALGELRTSEFSQLPALRSLLDDAATDPAITSLAVFSHHPPRDPLPGDASDLADPKEAALLEEWLSDWEAASGKDAAFVGAGVGVFWAERVDGVPYLIVGNSGKNPAGGPDSGGFTGWALLGVEEQPGGSDQWLQAQVTPRLEDLRVDGPERVTAGEAATVTITGVQDDGAREFPLDWPVSVDYRGSQEVFVGPVEDAPASAVAAYDPVSDTFTGVRVGRAVLAVTVSGRSASLAVEVLDACPDGHEPGAPIAFPGTTAPSGVPDVERPDGCTILDLVDARGPFASRGRLVAAVSGVTAAFVDDGSLSPLERARIIRDAARSQAG